MKRTNAIIGGEGNGGIIYPESHYGRDSLVGVGLFLTAFVKSGLKMSDYKNTFPQYVMSKNKVELTAGIDVDNILATIANDYKNEEVSTIDGVKIDFKEGWVHLRKSNTEPIIRIYSESKSSEMAENLANTIINKINSLK